MKQLKTIGIFNPALGFYTKGSLFTVLLLFAAFFNYLVYPVIARVLEIEQFGEFSVMLSLITQVGSVMLAFNIISIYLVSKLGDQKSRAILVSVQKGLVAFTLAIFMLFILFSPFIKDVLKLGSYTNIALLALILILAIPGAVWSGFFQGNGELIRVGVFSLFLAFSKFILTIVFAYKFGITGALVGVLLGSLIGLTLFWFLPGRKPPLQAGLIINSSDINHLKQYSLYILKSIIAVGLVFILQIFDLISVKSIFSPEIAGAYSGTSTLARIVFYSGFILIWVLLPEIAKAGKEHLKNLLIKSYSIYALIGLVAVAFVLLGGSTLIPIFLGPTYEIGKYTALISILFQITALIITFQTFVLLIFNSKWLLIALVIGTVLYIFAPILLDITMVSTLISIYTFINVCILFTLGLLIIRNVHNAK